MRRCLSWCLVCSLFACDGPPPAASGADVMVLELGGENVSLGEALLSVRSPIEVPDEPFPPELLPVVEPVVEKPVLAVLRTVTLSGGQTLYGLAQEHLGSGNRWPELLELNQWTEEDALRLPPGTKVKLPDN